jgi:DNA primase catalytic core
MPDEELERLKAEVSLVRLVEERGIGLRRHGKDLVGLCPFHDDHEPSLVVSPGKNLWHCMGACAAGGSVIDWVMRSEGVSFRHAVELLQAGMPGGVSSGPPPARSSTTRLAAPVDADASDAELLAQVVAFYHETLAGAADAMAYLERRQISDPEAVERFQVGYANRTLGYRLPNKQRRDGAAVRGRLQRLGVLRSSGHEHFSGSVVIPVIDDTGVVREVYGRKIRDDLRAGTPAHLYLPGPHAGVFNAAGITGVAEVIVCESLIDALTFWCAGFRHVTTAYGIEGFTAELHDAVIASGASRVLIAYDRDEAGDRAADALAARLSSEGAECFRVCFPAATDANAYACAAASPTDALGRLLRAAAWMTGAHPTNQAAVAVVAAKEEAGDPEPETAALSFAAEQPTAILLTTTAVDVDEELLNRCLVLTVDEDRAQTRAIHHAQRARETLEGRLATVERERILGLHHNAQRLLAPLMVANPYAPQLTFTDGRTRTRRDHTKYLTLIRTVALLHQHQRPKRTAVVDGRTVTYIEATIDDVALANRLAHDVLGRSLDELAPQTRRLLELLDGVVSSVAVERAVPRQQVTLTRRELRERLGWGDTQLKVHLARLVDLELVVAHRSEHGGAFGYELAWEGAGRDGERFLVGLTDPATLTAAYGCDDSRSGPDRSRSGGGRPPVGPRSGGGRTASNGPKPLRRNGSSRSEPAAGTERADTGPGGEQVVVARLAAGGGC